MPTLAGIDGRTLAPDVYGSMNIGIEQGRQKAADLFTPALLERAQAGDQVAINQLAGLNPAALQNTQIYAQNEQLLAEGARMAELQGQRDELIQNLGKGRLILKDGNVANNIRNLVASGDMDAESAMGLMNEYVGDNDAFIRKFTAIQEQGEEQLKVADQILGQAAGPLKPTVLSEGDIAIGAGGGVVARNPRAPEVDDSPKYEQVYDSDGNVLGQMNTQSGKVESSPLAGGDQEQFTPVYNEAGDIVGQQSSLTGRVVSDPRAPTGGGKITPQQRLAAGFAERTTTSGGILSELGGDFTGFSGRLAGMLPRGMKTEDRQRFEQAERDFINATLRRESGAAIQASEFASAREQYIPLPGDSDAVLAQKQRNREVVSNALQLEAGGAFAELQEQMNILPPISGFEFEPSPAEEPEGTEAYDEKGNRIVVEDGMWVKG